MMKAASEEAFTWAILSHENISPFLGMFVTEWQFFYVYPCGENGTLREWRRKNKPPINKILEHVSGRLFRLGHAHTPPTDA